MSTGNIPPLKPISANDVAWEEFAQVPAAGIRYRHLAGAAASGAFRVGVAIEEVLPGRRSGMPHYHILEEEHVFMLDGALTVPIGAEEFEMKAGDYVCFPAGQKAGHVLINRGSVPARYVIVGENNPNEVVVFTHSNKVMVRALGRRAIYDLASRRGYWEGEVTGLPEGVTPPGELGPPPAIDPGPRPPVSSDTVAWEEWSEGTRFGGRVRHLTAAALGRDYRVGMLIEEVAPGRQSCPFHYHLLEEEHALVLSGQGTLRLGSETFEMKPWDYACFPAGQAAGHCFVNKGSEPFRYLMIGERNPSDVCVYPDSNKILVRALEGQRNIFDLSALRDYWDGENP